MLISATIFFATCLQQGLQDQRRVLQFAGRKGVAISASSLDEELGNDRVPLSRPCFLRNGALVFFSIPHFYTVFDASYGPLRTLYSRQQLTNLIENNGLHAVLEYSKLPSLLWDELTDRIEQKYPGYQIPSDTLVTIGISVKSTIKVNGREVMARQEESNTTPTADEETALKTMPTHPLYYRGDIAKYENGRDLARAEAPSTRIFHGKVKLDNVDFAIEDDALSIFSEWMKTTLAGQNAGIYKSVEKLGGWKDKRSFLGEQLVREYAQANPDGFYEIKKDLIAKYAENGFRSASTVETDILGGSFHTSLIFKVSFYFSNGKAGWVTIG